MKKISIRSKQYVLKYTLRAFFTFENMTGYPFIFGKSLDEYILFYSMLLVNNESFDIPFDEFIAACDNDPLIFNEFKDFMLKEIELQAQSASGQNTTKKKKKTKE